MKTIEEIKRACADELGAHDFDVLFESEVLVGDFNQARRLWNEVGERYIKQFEPKQLSVVNEDDSYLILSKEGNIDTEHQFCMDCKTLEEDNIRFDNFKRGEFNETYLYIYKAKKIREE